MHRLKTVPIMLLGLVVSSATAQQGSLTVDTTLGDMTDKYLSVLEQQQLATTHKEIAELHTADMVRQRKAYVDKTLREELGGFPEKTPLEPQITGEIDHSDYRVQKLVYQSMPHFYVTADVYVPKQGQGPYPAVLGVAGHSNDGKAAANYQTVWISLAKRGFIVLAIDPVGQGERIGHLDPQTHKQILRPNGTMEHMDDGLQALLTGTNIARYFVWDGIRGVDYLRSRSDVDKDRIGVAGNSGGGTQSAYIASMEPRIAAAVVSCYLSAWTQMWMDPGPQDAEQVFNRFLADHLDYGAFLTAISPRPVQMQVATKDFFPIEGAHETFAEEKRLFQVLGVDDHLDLFEAGDMHGWSKPRREATYKWFARWLQHREDDGHEDEITAEAPSALNATRTGQVLTSYPDAETVQSLNAELAERLRAKPLAATGAQLAALVRNRLSLPTDNKAPSVDQVGSVSRNNVSIEKINIHSEAGITVPGLLFKPSGGPDRKPAILYVTPAGMATDATTGGPIDRLVEQGNVVLAIDPRGWGESAPPVKWTSGYPASYQVPMRAILVGKSMPAMQTYDILRAFQYLTTRPDINPRNISLYTKDKATNIGLLAVAVEPRIKRIVFDKQPMSYLEMTQLKVNRLAPDIFLPGVLRDFDLPDVIRILGPRAQSEQ